MKVVTSQKAGITGDTEGSRVTAFWFSYRSIYIIALFCVGIFLDCAKRIVIAGTKHL